MVDTRRAVPNEESRRPVLYCPMAGYQSVLKADDRYRLLFTTPGTVRRETGILTVGHHPHVSTICLHDVIARDQISVFHTGSDEILEVGTAWERG